MRWLAGLAMLLALPAAAQTRATIDSGVIEGKREGVVSAYLGVPFAADAGGDNRWRAPQPAPHWQGVRRATEFGPACVQDVVPNRGAIGPWTWEYLHQGPVSEDCLSVNVWTPAEAPGAKLPVLVWLYGGGFTSGSNAVPLYDGSALAARGIVVVTVNYRVGPYGFLAHPELTREVGSSGNYALLDQIAGLEWVKRNIAAFGGDAGAVTIAGQSAGAASVHALIASPLAKGLFHRAIAQSGSGMGRMAPPLAVMEASGTTFAQVAGATTLAELRALTPEQIATAARAVPGRPWAPASGTPVLPDPDVAVSDVPVLTGLTADEGSALGGDYGAATAAAHREAMERRYGASAPVFLALYPAADDAAAQASARAAARDRGIAAMLGWARARPAGSAPVHGSLWTHAEPGSEPRYRAFHSAELAYVFDTLGKTPERPFTDRDREIARTTGDYWANFVKTGDPNGPGLAVWPKIGSGRIMELGERFEARPALSPEVQAAFDAFAASGGTIGLF